MSEHDTTAAVRDRHALVALQAALLPAGVPVLPRVAVGAAYLLAETEAGGNWYDTVVRTDGSLGLIVGDVVGHGIAAAAAMGQLRAVARYLLDTADSPAAVVTELDRFAALLPEARTATVCVVLLHPVSGAVEYCTAGHSRPLLVSATGPTARYLTASGDGPLFSGSSYRDRSDHLSDGDLLLLYTDGIMTGPGRRPGRSAERLVDVVVAAAARPETSGELAVLGVPDDLDAAQRVCDQTLVRCADQVGRRADTALLAVGRHLPVGIVELSLPDTPAAVSTVRVALEVWLDTLRVDPLTGAAVQQAVDEVVTNAVMHAHPDAPAGAHRLTVRAELTATGQLEVMVADTGSWRAPAPAPHRGVGLALAAEQVEELTVERAAGGTTVCLRRPFTRPVPMLTTMAVAAPAVTIARAGSVGRIDADPADPAGPDDEQFVAALTHGAGLDDVLVVGGPVDVLTATALRDQLRAVTEGGTLTRTVDLSRVTLLASAGVHVLFEARRRSLAHHERLHLLAPHDSPARRVLERVGLGPDDQT